MNAFRPSVLSCLLASMAYCCSADGEPAECLREQVDAHVRDQIRLYGPQSVRREYFAFVYVYQGAIASAVVRSSQCVNSGRCSVQTAASAQLIPKGAHVLGEWHTHPHGGSGTLSMEDVRGAYNNRHLRCYAPYYAKPNGEILTWDPHKTSVPTAMASRVLIGNYSDEHAQLALSAKPDVQHAGMLLGGAARANL
jgi:hypothetical protein